MRTSYPVKIFSSCRPDVFRDLDLELMNQACAEDMPDQVGHETFPEFGMTIVRTE